MARTTLEILTELLDETNKTRLEMKASVAMWEKEVKLNPGKVLKKALDPDTMQMREYKIEQVVEGKKEQLRMLEAMVMEYGAMINEKEKRT
jgi:hypothetical protein